MDILLAVGLFGDSLRHSCARVVVFSLEGTTISWGRADPFGFPVIIFVVYGFCQADTPPPDCYLT